MKYHVVIRPAAEREFDRQYHFIRKQSPRGAAAWTNAFYRSLQSLRSNPHAHSLAPEDDDHHAEIRQLLFKTRKGRIYRALFTVRESNVFILHIRGAVQDIMSPDEIDLP